MKNALFNNIISLEYPEDFYEMKEDEIKQFFGGDLLRFGARNVEKHVILSIAKTKSSFLSFLASPKSVLSGAENNLRSNLKGYKLLEEFEVEMLSKQGVGMRFEYSAIDKDIKQFAEMAVVKFKNDFYVTYCLSRLEDKLENEELFERFRNSLKTLTK